MITLVCLTWLKFAVNNPVSENSVDSILLSKGLAHPDTKRGQSTDGEEDQVGMWVAQQKSISTRGKNIQSKCLGDRCMVSSSQDKGHAVHMQVGQ